jgi:hypothetical protein
MAPLRREIAIKPLEMTTKGVETTGKPSGVTTKGVGNRWLHAQRITHPVKQLLGLSVEIADASVPADMPPLLSALNLPSNRIIQILYAFNCRFLGPNSR